MADLNNSTSKSKLVAPASAQEASNILLEANGSGQPLSFQGGNTKADYGNLTTPSELTISTQKLEQLVAYQPEDLTITVGAGMQFDYLQEILAKQGQWLPIDPPHLEGATLGGLVATNLSGPKRLLYGTARDLVLGCQFVLADGRIGRSGGRVVKNVTGYDLHKLMIGSFGTLGLITEITFKVLPLPEYSEWVKASFSWNATISDQSESENLANIVKVARLAASSNNTPAALEIVGNFNFANDTELNKKNELTLFFAAEGVKVAVYDQIKNLKTLCEQNKGQLIYLNILENLDVQTQEKIYTLLRDRLASLSYNLIVKCTATLTKLHLTFKIVRNIASQLHLTAHFQIRAGTGIIYLYTKMEEAQVEQAAQLLEAARQEIQQQGGSLVLERAPANLKAKLDIFGEVGDTFTAMQALKTKLDPQAILNPGRFLKGL
jgi:glycolate oxidase FAD binding subunit